MSKLPAPGADPYTYARHSGIDFLRGAAWFRKAFYASGPGVIRRLSYNAAGGNWVVVKYDDIPYEVGYAHLDHHGGCPRPGTRVNLGTQLGYVGETGTRVTGPHIHMEILGLGTDTAVWLYFDRDRVVGVPSGAAGDGGTTKPPQSNSNSNTITTPSDPTLEEEENMITVITNSAGTEWSLIDPDCAHELPRFNGKADKNFRSEKTTKGVVNTYRGFMVTTDPDVAAAWGRTHCRAYGNAPQKRLGNDYKAAQVEASRVATNRIRSS